MFDAFLQIWYRLYCKGNTRRSAKVFVDRQSTVCFVRKCRSGMSGYLYEPAAAGSIFTFAEFCDRLIRSDASLIALAEAGSLAPEEVEALLLISQALVATLEYNEVRAEVDRALLTALSVWRMQALDHESNRALMYRWFWLVLSDSRPLQVVRSHTEAVRRDGWLLPMSRGRGHITPCELFSVVAKKQRVLNSIGRHLGIDKHETEVNIKTISDLLVSLRHVGENRWTPIWAPGDIIGMWRSDKERFSSTLKWALDGFVLVHRDTVADVPPAEKSMGVMDALATTRTAGVPVEVKAHLEYFVDVTIMAVVRSLGDLESLLAQFGEDSRYTAKFLYILVNHLFRNERVLLSLARAHSLLSRCPDGPWRTTLLRFVSAHSGRRPK